MASIDDVKDKQLLQEYRKLLLANETTGWSRFDDLVFKITAGGLGLSLALLGAMRDTDPTDLRWMFAAWLLSALTLIALLVSVITGQYGLRSQIAHIDAGTFRQVRWPDGVGALTPWLNHLAAISCAGALLCLLIFAAINIPGDRHMARSSSGNFRGSGQVSPQAPAQSAQTSGSEQRGQVSPQAPAPQPTSGTIVLPGGAGQVSPQAPPPASTPPPSK
jgi:hypothetical protein